MDLGQIIPLFKDMGWTSGIILLCLLIVYKSKDPMGDIASTLRSWAPRLKKRDSYNLLMSKIDYWLNFKIDSLALSDSGRQEIFKDLVKARLRAMKSICEEMHNTIDGSWTSERTLRFLYEKGNEVDANANAECIKMGIPKVVVDKYDGALQFSRGLILISLEVICTTPFYDTTAMRMEAVWACLIGSIEVSIAQGERSIMKLNGELTGIEYKGYVCQHPH